MITKLPAMADAALAVLRANAERLGKSGTKTQKSAAAALMPAIDAELEARRAAKLGRTKAKAALRRHGPKADAEPESANG